MSACIKKKKKEKKKRTDIVITNVCKCVSFKSCVSVCVGVCACVRAYVRACVRACVCVVCACLFGRGSEYV